MTLLPDGLFGEVQSGFEAVADAFAANLARGDEIGASCCVYRDGFPVVDIWGGWADRESQRPWGRDTVSLTFSATKGAAAICALRLVDQGRLDLDSPVAQYWPEFAACGKDTILVRWLLSHRAGLPEVVGDLTMEEVFAWDPVVDALAAQAPSWEPGTKHGYHMRSFGWLVGELVRRVSGAPSFGAYLASEVCGPLDLELWVGFPGSERGRLALLYPPPAEQHADIDAFLGGEFSRRVVHGPSDLFYYDDRWNDPALQRAEIPSSNGIGNARAFARMYAALLGEVDGHRLLHPDTVEMARQVQSAGPDAVVLFETRFGLGFALPPMFGPSVEDPVFGHPGAGGSVAFADPATGLAFAYVANKMVMGAIGDRRSADLIAAMYGSL